MKNKTGLNIVIYFLLFLAGDLGSSLIFDLIFSVITLPTSELYAIPRILGAFVLTYFLFWFYTKKILHMELRDFGITGKVKCWSVLLAILLPVSVVAVYMIIGKLQMNDMPSNRICPIVLASLLVALKSGITEEMLFRGFIMKLMERKWNKAVAILAPSLVFALVHIFSLETYTLSGVLLLIVSGTLVGVMFSLVAYKGNSIANSAIMHIVWNLFFATSILHITTQQGSYGEPLFSIIIPSENLFITGGDFGVEAAIVAIIGYAVVCVVTGLIKAEH